MNGVDLRRFEFDYDTTWAAFFLDADLNVYSRYGGRDGGEPDDRLSRDSLLRTMDEVLEVHRWRDQHPEQPDRHLLQPLLGTDRRPEQIPLLAQSHQGCLHCHQVREYQLLQWNHDRQFDRAKLFPYPLPENLGFTVDRSHGHRVQTIEPDSLASRLKLRSGDTIERINETPIRSEFDIRWALHHHNDSQPIHFEVTTTTGERRKISLPSESLAEGWRMTELGWRKSLRSVPLDAGFRGYALTRSQQKAVGLSSDSLALKIVAVKDRGLARSLGLQRNDIIVGLEQQSMRREFSDFLSDLLRKATPGRPIQIIVLRDGVRVTLNGTFPDWNSEETSVP